MWHLFIAYTADEKDDRALAQNLMTRLRDQQHELHEVPLSLGDNLGRKLQSALQDVNCGVLILSHAFFDQLWARRDLDHLAKEAENSRPLVPIWHGVTADEIRSYSRKLADVPALSAEADPDVLADEIREIVLHWTDGLYSAVQQAEQSFVNVQKTGTLSPPTKGQSAVDMYNTYHKMTDTLSESELRLLAYDLGLDFDKVAGTTKAGRIRNMMVLAQRHGQSQALMSHLSAMRPDIDW